MIILSLNIRGLGGRPKTLGLRSLLESLHPDLILLQEKMCSDLPALISISKFLPSWEYCAVSARGLSGGLLSAWNPRSIKCKAYHTFAGILLQAHVRGLSFPLNILNVYGPYKNRIQFWDNTLSGGLLNLPNLVLAGDLNLTLSPSEVCGCRASLDPNSDYFLDLFNSVGLVDVAPPTIGPTWRNGRSGEEGICKRLDRYLISNALLPHLGSFRTWTHRSLIFDHFPILLEWNHPKGPFNYPFKFNRSWLENSAFSDWFLHWWKHSSALDHSSDIEDLCITLRNLKSDAKLWMKEQSASFTQTSLRLDSDIESILSLGILSKEQIDRLSRLNAERLSILEHHQLTWKLKSRLKWDLQGDSNTKFFHSFASGRRTHNTIWSLEDEEGIVYEDDGPLKELGKSFFAKIFKDEGNTSLDHQLKVISLFPRMILPDKSSCLTSQVTITELESALHSFNKDRSPGPDGWPVEFYLHFFNLLGPTLVQMVDYTRTSGYIPSSLNSTFITLIPKKDKPRTFADFRPISLCNLLYKLIAKVIAGRLKPFLDSGISHEQFGFLKDRQITEPIGIVQEVLYSVKIKNSCSFVLKLDLSKAFDRVD